VYNDEEPDCDYDVVLECSGNKKALNWAISMKGKTVLSFGFGYEEIMPDKLVSNEISLIGTLGASKEDFAEAINYIPYMGDFPYEEITLTDFMFKSSSVKTVINMRHEK
jgi:threonine dehydrogenase-like Zn-dependent dehydrogenase